MISVILKIVLGLEKALACQFHGSCGESKNKLQQGTQELGSECPRNGNYEGIELSMRKLLFQFPGDPLNLKSPWQVFIFQDFKFELDSSTPANNGTSHGYLFETTYKMLWHKIHTWVNLCRVTKNLPNTLKEHQKFLANAIFQKFPITMVVYEKFFLIPWKLFKVFLLIQ